MGVDLALCLLTLFALAALGMPVAYALILSTIVYMAVSGQDLALPAEQMIQGLYDSFVLLAVPLFIVAANIMNAGTISERLLRFCVALVGRFRGGMAHVDVIASVIFSGMSGSAVADAAGIGKITIDMMLKTGHYTRGYAAAIVAASATIGPIIPPSIPMVLYALVSGASIGYLFLAGILPGLVMAGVLMVMNAIIARRRGLEPDEGVPLAELPRRTVEAFPALMMPVILLYGIYGGLTTPTEAAGIAALYALLVAGLLYRALSLGSLHQVFVESARSAASVGLIIGASLIFNYILANENVPGRLAGVLAGLDVAPLTFLIGVNLALLVLGCFLDATTINLVHFGVVATVNLMIGLITPPYGILLFVINATTGIPLKEIIRELIPFMIVLVIALALMILFPAIVLTVPRLFGYEG
jgi:tripartite ATP-independent transporter DctM subunit